MNPKNPSPLQWQFDEDEDANMLLGEELFGGLGLLDSLSQSRDQADRLKFPEDSVELPKRDGQPEKLDPEFSPSYFNSGGYHHSDQNLDAYGQQILPEIDIQEYTNNLRRLGKEFIKYGTAYLKERNNQKPFYVEYIREQLAERVQNNTLGFTIYSIDLLVEGLIKLMQIDGRLLYDTNYRAKYDVFWLNKSELANVHGHQQFQQFKQQHDQQQLLQQQQLQQHSLSSIPQPITSNGPYFSPNQISPQDAYINNNPNYHGISPQQQLQQQQHLLQPFNTITDGTRPPVPPGPPPLMVYNGGAASQGQFPPNRVQLPVQKIGEMKSTLLQERYDSVVKEIAEDIIHNAVRRLQRPGNTKPFRVSEIKNSLKHRETLLKHWLTAAEASVLAIMKTDPRLRYDGAYKPHNDNQTLEVFWLTNFGFNNIIAMEAPRSPTALSAPPGLSSSTASSVSNSVATSVTNSVASSPDIAASPPVSARVPPITVKIQTAVPKLKMATAQAPPVLVPHLSALERINKLPASGAVSAISPRDGIASPRDAIKANSPRDGAGTVRQITSTTQSNRAASQAASARTTSPLPGQSTPQTIVVKAVSSGGVNSGGLNKGGTSSTGGMTIIRETSPPGGSTSTAVPPVVSTENVINSVHDTNAITTYLAVIAKIAKQFTQKAITHLETNLNKQPYLVANIRIAIAKSDFESSIAYRIPDQEEFLLDVIDTLREDDRLLYASKNSENMLEGFWLNKSQ
eukprot:gene26963-33616_t